MARKQKEQRKVEQVVRQKALRLAQKNKRRPDRDDFGRLLLWLLASRQIDGCNTAAAVAKAILLLRVSTSVRPMRCGMFFCRVTVQPTIPFVGNCTSNLLETNPSIGYQTTIDTPPFSSLLSPHYF